MRTGGPFPEVKERPGRDADHPPSSAEVGNEWELYSSPPKRLYGVWWYILKNKYKRLIIMYFPWVDLFNKS
jgi:hypothetical protein